MIPRYEMTLEQLQDAFHVLPVPVRNFDAAGLPAPLARVGIALDRRPIEGTDYTCQVGLVLSPRNPSLREWASRCPAIDRTDGKVSGVVVFDGDRVIAHYTNRDAGGRPAWLVGVDPEYRRRGLATLAILEWFKAAPFHDLIGWPINEAAVMPFLRAHRMYIEWERDRGTEVPIAVIDSIRKVE